MAQTKPIIQALKQALKAQGVRYSDVAKVLDLSEASVKRLFAEEQLSLKRLDQICQYIGLEISDLVLAIQDQHKIKSLSLAQEKEVANDVPLLLIANAVLNRLTFSDILRTYNFTEHELIRYMAKLDRLGLIELLPNNRIKLLVDRQFSWIKKGPIEKFFEQQVQQEFFSSRFDAPGEARHFLVGMLSRESNAQFQRKLQQLAETFHQLHLEDEKRPVAERFGTSVFVGMRPWEPRIFEQYRREEDKREF